MLNKEQKDELCDPEKNRDRLKTGDYMKNKSSGQKEIEMTINNAEKKEILIHPHSPENLRSIIRAIRTTTNYKLFGYA